MMHNNNLFLIKYDFFHEKPFPQEGTPPYYSVIMRRASLSLLGSWGLGLLFVQAF